MPDAGSVSARLVDAETVERHPTLTPGERRYDVEQAAELMDLRSGGLLPEGIDPIELARCFSERYAAVWRR